jgi:hypothetical protein
MRRIFLRLMHKSWSFNPAFIGTFACKLWQANVAVGNTTQNLDFLLLPHSSAAAALSTQGSTATPRSGPIEGQDRHLSGRHCCTSLLLHPSLEPHRVGGAQVLPLATVVSGKELGPAQHHRAASPPHLRAVAVTSS